MDILKYKVDVDSATGTARMEKFNKTMRKSAQDGSTMKKSMLSAGSAVRGLVAAYGVTKMVQFTKRVVEQHDQMIKLGRQVGISTQNIAGFQYAAKLGGADAEKMNDALKTLAKNMVDASNGTGEAKESLSAMGISLADGDGKLKNLDTAILEISDKFATMKDGVEKNTAAQKLFGGSGDKMINMLNQGSDALKQQIDEGARLTGVTDGTAKIYEQFNDAITKTQTAGTGLVAAIVSTWSPELKKFAELVSKGMSNMAEKSAFAQNMASQQLQGDKADLAVMKSKLRYTQILIEKKQNVSEQERIEGGLLFNRIREKEKELGLSKEELKMVDMQADSMARRMVETKNGIKAGAEAARTAHESAKQAMLDAQKQAEASASEITGIMEKKQAEAALQAQRREAQAERAEEIKNAIDLLERQRDMEQQAIQVTIDAYNDATDAQRAFAAELMTEDQKSLQSIADKYNYYSEFIDDKVALDKWAAGEIRKIEEQNAKERTDKELALIKQEEDARLESIAKVQQAREQAFQVVGQISASLNGAISDANQIQLNGIANTYDTAKARLQAKSAAEIKAAEGNATRQKTIEANLQGDLAKLDEKRAKEEYDIKKKSFGVEKALSTVEAVMNGAVAVTKAYASAPPPLNFILAGTVAAATATQVGVIQSQKFAQGGEPIGRNATVTMNEGGQQEGVINGSAYRAVGRDFLQAINAGRVEEAFQQKSGGTNQITVNLSGVIDKRAVQNVLLPALNDAMRNKR